MAKQLNVNLAISADTSAAQKNLLDLQNSLNNLSSITPIDGTKLTNDMQKAISSARSLEYHLTNAFNVNTGNIDLNKLDTSLKSANTNLATLTNGLLRAGVQGEQAFMNVQRALSSANVQITKANGMLAQFLITLKNTARWQLSSSVLHGFIGGLQSAYGYAQDLNKSLNNIRIVTGYNIDEMSNFAEEANKAAKALHSTTTEYTNASLIYYQQGLSADEVKERTDITIKMANVARESAETVSDQLTAVWNNFAKNGTQSLEHYADAMTKLGAETASSTDEIAGGLEKFASVADMIGLSFDNAAAALATITATTRQSEEVVGTALKTIFARIQGLSLGETLDDGTTLNKYSEALDKVGISIYNSAGGLKDMDNILAEMGAKWDTLSDAQQTALAQTVAGVRQYTQLVALMENFDFYQQNVDTAKNADGELDKQAEIYAESWEAARDKVKAATEGIFNDLIPTEAIIDITNGFAEVLEGVDSFIEGIGGIGNILLMISTIALNKMGPSLGSSLQIGIDKIAHLNLSFDGLKSKFQSGTAQATKLRQTLNEISGVAPVEGLGKLPKTLKTATDQTEYFKKNLESSASAATKLSQSTIDAAMQQGRFTDEFSVYMNDMAKVNNLQAVIEKSRSRLTTEQQQQLALQQQQVIAASELHQKEVQNLSILQEKAMTMAETVDYSVRHGDNFVIDRDTGALKFDTGMTATENMRNNINEMFKLWQQFDEEIGQTGVTISSVGDHFAFVVEDEKKFLQLNKGSLSMYTKTITLTDRIRAIADDTNVSAEERKKRIEEIVSEAQQEKVISKDTADAIKDGAKSLTDQSKASKDLKIALRDTRDQAQQFAAAAGNGKERLAEAEKVGSGIASSLRQVDAAAGRTNLAIDNVVNSLRNGVSQSMNLGNSLVKVAGGMSTLSMGINSLSNMFDTLGDSSATGLQKFSSVAMGSVMTIQGLMVVVKGINALLDMHTAKLALDTIMQQVNTATTEKDMAVKLADLLLSKKKISDKEHGIIIEKLEQSIRDKGLKQTVIETAANYGLAASEMAVLWPIGLIIAALGLLAAAFFGARALIDAFTVSNEEMVERTSAASESLAKSAKEAKEEAEGIKSAFEDYDEIVDTLESCTKGTDEWETALDNVRNKIDDILEQYPDLLKYKGLLEWDDRSGIYLFNKDVTDQAIADAEKRADTLNYASQMASGKASSAKANLIKEEYDDHNVTAFYNDNTGYNNISKSVHDFADTSQMTGSKTENRAVLEQGARDYLSTVTKTELDSQGNQVQVGLSQDEIDSIINQWSNSLDAAAEAGVDYANKTEEAANTLLQASKLAAAEMLKDENGETEYDQAAVNAGAKAVQDKYDEIYDEIYGTNGSDGLIGKQYSKSDNRQDVGKNGAEDVLTRYEEAVGHDVDWAANAVQGNDQNRTFVYLEDGEEKSLSPEQLAATVAAYESTKDANLVETAAQAVQNIIGANAGDATGIAAINAISNGGTSTDLANVFSTFTEDQLNNINEAFADGTTPEEISEILGLSPDELNQLLEAFGISFEDFAANTQAAASNVADSLTDAKQDILDSAGVTNTGSMTMGEKIAYADNINIVKTKLAEEDLGGDLVNQIITDIENSDIDPTTMSEFLNEVGQLDLTAEDTADKVAELAEQYGIEGKSVTDLIGSIEGLDQVYNVSTDNIAKTAQALKDIVGNGLEVGDIISAEDMQALSDAGLNVDDYFTKMADGSYALTGSAEEFNRTVNQISFNGIKDQLNDFEKARAQAVENTNYAGQNNLLTDETVNDSSQEFNNARLDYISSFNEGTFDFNTDQLALLQEYKANPEITLTAEQLQLVQEMIGVVNEKENEMKAQALLTATSMEDLRAKMAELGSVSSLDYGAALVQLASQHENCTQEVQDYQEALMSGDSAQIEAATSALELAVTVGETAKKYDLSAEDLEVYSKRLKDLEGNENLSEEAAVKLAAANMRLDRGVANLKDNLADYRKALKDNNKGSAEWSKTLTSLKGDLADIANVADGSMLSDSFAEDIASSEILEKALNGDSNAILELRTLAADDIIQNLEVDDSSLATVNEQWEYLKANMANGVSAEGVDQSALIESFNQMIEAGNMTKDQIEAALSGLNVSANIKTTYHTQPTEVPTYVEVAEPDTPVRYQIGTDPETGEPIYGETQGIRRYTIPGEPITVEGSVPTYSIEGTTDGEGTSTTAFEKLPPPKVSKSVTNPSTSGGGNKNKSGSASKERYHTVNKRIDKANREKDRASANKDQVFGKDKLKYITEELKAIKDLQNAYADYYDEIANPETGYLAKDLKEIQKLGINVTIEDGIITNWDEIIDAEKAAYEEVMNNQYATEASQEAAQQRWDEVNKLIEQYEATVEEFEKVKDQIAELERERISKELEEITTEVDFEIEIKQRDLDRLERIVDRLSRDTNNMIEIIDKLGEQVNAYGDQSQWYINGIQRIQQNAISEGRELTDEEQRKIWEYQDALEEINDSLEDIIETVENSLLEEFERWNSEIDENISRFDTYSSTLEHYSEIIKLSGRATKDSALLMSLQMQKTSIAMQELNAVYDKYQANLDAQKNVKEKLDLAISSGDAEDIEYWQKQYDEITKTVEKNAEEVAATWQDALQAASDEFDFVVEQTIQKLKDSISEFGLDGLADRYEKAKTINEQYLSDLDKEYELNKLIRQVEGSIDETDNLNAKRELIKLLDEINEKTAEGVKLSQYDLEYMQAEYELELAKLALEEARNAKTSVRLQRGDDGNYSYVYTADQEAIANAEQNYEDKLHAIKTLSQNHIDEMSDLIIQNEQELMEALAAVDRTKFETEEAYQAELNRITEYYYERDTYLRTELNKAVQNMGLVYGDTILGQLENCSTWEQAQEQLKTNTNTAITTMVSAWSKWKSDTETAMSIVGTSSNTLTNTIQTDATKIATATSNLANTIDTQTSNMKKYIDGLIEKIWEWRDEYLAAIRAMQNTNSSFSSNIAYDPNADYSALMGSVEYGSDEYNIYKGYREYKVNDPNYTGKGKNVSTARVDAFLRNGHTLAEIGKEYYTDLTEDEWIKYAGFKTGGYTGEWGPEGKLAYLHEKELVLNAKDTQNILNAVDLVRTISQKLDRQAQIAALGFASKANAHNGTNDSQTIQVEQDVTIHAEFPNATDQNEIKEAILGLVNYTAQYVAKR